MTFKRDETAMPLFYEQPRLLSAQAHGDLRLRGERDFRFAASANAVPLMAPEFVEAQPSYPIVFVGEPAHPVAVLGLARESRVLRRRHPAAARAADRFRSFALRWPAALETQCAPQRSGPSSFRAPSPRP